MPQPDAMQGRLRFGLLAILYAILMFATVMWTAVRVPSTPANVGFMVPVLAIVLAAAGVSYARKAIFLAGSVVMFALVDVLAAVSGLQATAVLANADMAHASLGGLIATVVYHVFSIGFPIAVLIALAGRRPRVLWEA